MNSHVILSDLLDALEEIAPLQLAESWDNVGLILGDPQQQVSRVMTCLTLTDDVAAEAIAEQVELIVSHHPILFRPVQKLTALTHEGRLVSKLIQHQIAVYSPHTAYDSAAMGINAQIAHGLGLQNVRPLRPGTMTGQDDLGAGRWGTLQSPMEPEHFLARIRSFLKVDHLACIGEGRRRIQRVAVACGAAGEFLTDAIRNECDLFLTGETRFHTCLEARDQEILMVLPGHYVTERHGVEHLARLLQSKFPVVQTWASQVERDPIVITGEGN